MTTPTFTFDATWIGAEGIESEIMEIQAETLREAVQKLTLQINGSNAFADCLIDLQRIS